MCISHTAVQCIRVYVRTYRWWVEVCVATICDSSQSTSKVSFEHDVVLLRDFPLQDQAVHFPAWPKHVASCSQWDVFPSTPHHLLHGMPVGTAGKAAMALTAGVVWELLGNAVMSVEGTASLCLASLPAPFLSAVHLRMDTHMLPAGKATAKGQCPHSIQHLQCLPGVIRPLLLWCTHQPPVLSDSGPEGLCCRMPVDAPTDSDQTRPALHLLRSSQQDQHCTSSAPLSKTSTAPPPLLSAGHV